MLKVIRALATAARETNISLTKMLSPAALGGRARTKKTPATGVFCNAEVVEMQGRRAPWARL